MRALMSTKTDSRLGRAVEEASVTAPRDGTTTLPRTPSEMTLRGLCLPAAETLASGLLAGVVASLCCLQIALAFALGLGLGGPA
jgi:hypothetical protein